MCNNLKKELLFKFFLGFSVVLFHSLLHIMTNSHKMHWRIQGGCTWQRDFIQLSFFLEFFFVLTPPPRGSVQPTNISTSKTIVNFSAKPEKNRPNKNAFQWDAYRTLVDRIYQHALSRGLPLVPGGSAQRSVTATSPGMVSASGPGGGSLYQHAMGQTPPCGQTDTCENITFANFVCGR